MTIRRLAAILAADVAGFSAMMERNEEGTAARIRALRADVIEPALARHHGRLVKTTGDGFLAEFASPVEAVRSALAIQDQLGIARRTIARSSSGSASTSVTSSSSTTVTCSEMG